MNRKPELVQIVMMKKSQGLTLRAGQGSSPLDLTFGGWGGGLLKTGLFVLVPE